MNEEIPWRLIFLDALVKGFDEMLRQAAQFADTPQYQQHVKALQIAHNHMAAFLNIQRAGDAKDYQQALTWADRAQEARNGTADTYPALLPNSQIGW